MRLTRREFAKLSAAVGGAMALPWRFGAKALRAQIPGGTLPPGSVAKFVAPLVKPPVLPRKSKLKRKGLKNAEYYELAMKQFNQQILPAGMPQTTVWSYGPANAAPTLANRYFYPAFTLENKYNRPTVVKWVNGLGASSHILPVDQTLHWANPVGANPDTHSTDNNPYLGPVPMVTHVHGAHTWEESDGYPEAWYLPAGATGVNHLVGSRYAEFQAKSEARLGMTWDPGTAIFDYPNDQRATTLWYHDHTLGMTRVNVYAGPAGFYLIRGGPDDQVGGVLPGPAPGKGIDPFGEFFEIPIAIQDRSFNADGSLFYPDNRAFFDGFPGPYIPDSNVPPIWNPEFFGNMMVVNGQTWPYLNVKRQRYRFRFLNGCNSRFLVLKMTRTPRNDNASFNTPEGTFWQIGAEGGFLPQAEPLNHLLMAPAERADVIIDFSDFNVGEEVILVNDGPDAPFGGIGLEDLSDWESTGVVMKFIVGAGPATDPSTHPANLVLPAITPLGTAGSTRNVTLNEEMDNVGADVPSAALLGSGTAEGTGLLWSDAITENPAVGATEEWHMYNHTADAHPIHIHLVQFQVVGRVPFGGGTSTAGQNTPLPWETGFKDTVIAYPGEITTVKAKFDKAGLFVWHCHIVEHEDNEMMRPYRVSPPAV
jgi:FtsP/CotA-like multicopper oxidase with cupredoxin domain